MVMSSAASSSAPSRSPSLKPSIAARMISAFVGTESLALVAKRRTVDGLGEQHLLGEDQVGAVVVRHLVVVAHRDRVEGAGDLAVTAEDAAAEVDLVGVGVALAGGNPVLRVVLGGDHAGGVRRAGGG